MRQKDIDDLGGLKSDMGILIVPGAQTDSVERNEQAVDLAALTQIPLRAIVQWTTNAVAGVLDPSLVSHASIWGSDDGTKPSVERTAQGLWTVSYTSTFRLGYALDLADDEIETVSFRAAQVECTSATAADIFSGRSLTLAGSVCTLVTKSNAAAADVGNSSASNFSVSLFLY